MINALWLILIVPASAAAGYFICALMMLSKANDVDNETDL